MTAVLVNSLTSEARRLRRALRDILARTDGTCANYTSGIGSCFRQGRKARAEFGADTACEQCIAERALRRRK